jgi:hypothetical protein
MRALPIEFEFISEILTMAGRSGPEAKRQLMLPHLEQLNLLVVNF